MNKRIVLVTGGLSGIGRATAMAFAQEGASIVVSGRRDDAGAQLVRDLRAVGAEAAFFRADVRHEDEVQDLVERTVERFGGLDIAVNSAGTEGVPGPVTEQTSETYAAVFDTNVLGTLLSMKHELRVMRSRGSGCIVNVSSSMGHKAAPGMPIYTASKHAVEGLTKSAALEAAAYGVRVNAVAPGPIETEMLKRLTPTPEKVAAMAAGVPLKRAGQADEVARAVAFLASDAAAFITGHILWVDGGKSAG